MTPIHHTTRERIAAILTTLALACGGNDGGPAGTTASIAVAANPAALSVDQGTTGSTNVALTRHSGFAGVVTIAVSGLPTGVTATVTPTELSGAATLAAITLTVAAAVPTQTYTATITATGSGVAPATASVALTVTTRPATSTDVAYQYCDASTVPVFFASQDGTGDWQSVPAATLAGKTTFAFKLTQPRGGVVAVYRSSSTSVAAFPTRFDVASRRTREPAQPYLADTYITEVLYASPAELARDGTEICALTQPTKTVRAVVAGVMAGQYGILSLGPSTRVFDGAVTTNPVTFADVPTGALDFVAARITSPGLPPDRLVVLRNLDIASGGSLPATIDFNGPASSLPATATATITGASGDDLEIFTELVTARSGRSLLWFDLAPSKNAARPWAGLSAATMVTGDFHGVTVFATPASEGDFRMSLKYVGPVSGQTLALGPVMTAATTTVVGTGVYPRLRFQGTLPAEYNKGVDIELVSTASSGNTISIIASSAYLAASGDALRYDLFMPDLRGLDGFPEASRATAGPNDISASGFGFTGPGTFDLVPNLGGEFKAATKAATIVVP